MTCALLRTGGVEAPRLRQEVVRRLDRRLERFGRRGRRDGLVAVLDDGTARFQGVQGGAAAKHAEQGRGADEEERSDGGLHCYDYELANYVQICNLHACGELLLGGAGNSLDALRTDGLRKLPRAVRERSDQSPVARRRVIAAVCGPVPSLQWAQGQCMRRRRGKPLRAEYWFRSLLGSTVGRRERTRILQH